MVTTLFLQSEVQDPYTIYETMLNENPVYWDEANQLWAIYSYEACTAILNNTDAHIPGINGNNKQGLNEYALRITDRLARLSNGIQHDITRQVAMLLFDRIKADVINGIMGKLLQNEAGKNETDWVNSVCKKLPLAAVLKSFDFKEDDCCFISDKIEQLVKIMLPDKTPEQVAAINETSKEIYTITEKHLSASGFYKSILKTVSEKYKTGLNETTSLCVINLIGLFIQGYDAGRGVLSNSLLQILDKNGIYSKKTINKEWLQRSVIETLRFDPPVHNTRRVAVNDIALNGVVFKKGESILVVLAAANRDPEKFNRPGTYNIERANNNEHLTFGAGSHRCLANHFSVSLTTETLSYFLDRYKTIELIEKNIRYEPRVNTRLPKNILISFS